MPFDSILQRAAMMLEGFNWRNVLDIVIVSMVAYQVIRLVRQTRANSVSKGVGMILAITWLSGVAQLKALNWLLLQIINSGVVFLLILFQPELRRGLERIGRSRFSRLLGAERSEKEAEREAHELIHAMSNMARRKVGALIVIERQTGLSDIAANGTAIDAEISSALIENIFEPNTPLHDGAMIIRGGRILAAACYLPLSENSAISRELGTRHRAALGISESTDASVFIVSEETGIISLARDGRLNRYLDSKAMRALLMDMLSHNASDNQRSPSGSWRRKEGRNGGKP